MIAGLVRNYALRGALIDVPNERSSHLHPTPRGGGLGIVVATLIAIVWLGSTGALSMSFAFALGGGMTIIAAIGWIDDHRSVPARWRLLVHCLAAGWALMWLAPFPTQHLSMLPLLGLGIVWMTNLYNFMDGIDGLAGIQATFAGTAGGIILWLTGETSLATTSLAIAASAAGFLIWNWPPARLFMGDVGSCALGFAFAIIAIDGYRRGGGAALPVWTILLAPFLVDSGLTLITRILRGERWYLAHRSHAYQRLVRHGWTHLKVTVIFLLIDIICMAPLAFFAAQSPAEAWSFAGVALLLPGMLWIAVRKSIPDQPDTL